MDQHWDWCLGRNWHLAWSREDEWWSLYLYKTDRMGDDWVRFFGITWNPDPETFTLSKVWSKRLFGHLYVER